MNLKLAFFILFSASTFALTLFLPTSLSAQESRIQDYADYEQAYSAYEQGNIDETYIFLKRSLSDYPEHLPSKMLMGEVLALSGYYVDALTEFEESLKAGADANLIIESYIRSLMILEDYGRILDISEDRLTPNKLGFLFSAKAIAYKQRDDLQNAEVFFKKAYETAPNSHVVLNSAARHYLQSYNYGQAKTLIDQSIAANPNVSGTYELLAIYYGYKEDEQARVDALKTGLEINNINPVLMRELVSAYANKGEYQQAKDTLTTILESSPNDAMANLLLSWVSAELNDDELSKTTLNNLVNNLSLIDSSDLARSDSSLMVSAMANYAANNIEVARGQFEQYLNKNPNNFNAAKLLTEIYEREQSYIAAANTLEHFKDEVNESASLIARLCNIYIRANQNHKCNLLLERNRQKHGRNPIFVQAESNLFAARGKLDLALETLDDLDSSSISVLAQKAIIAIKDNRLDVATESVDQLLEDYGDNPDFLNLRGSILKKSSRLIEAEQVYLLVLEDTPNHFSANFNLAHIYYLTNRAVSAQTITESLLERSPNNIEVMLLYSKILIARENYTQAYDVLSRAQTLNSSNSDVDTVFIELYEATGELDKALLQVNKLLKNDLTNVQLLRKRATLNNELGNTGDAQKDLRILFGLMSDNAQALFDLSDIQGQFADSAGAMNSLQKADTLNPNNFFINRNIAKLAIAQNNLELAREKLDWLKDENPNNPDVLLLQGDFALANSDEQSAAKHYQNAIRTNSSMSLALIGAYQLAQQGVGVEGFIEVFSSLASDASKHVFATHLLADFYFAKGQYDNAKSTYISIAGETGYRPLPMVLNNLANIYVIEDKIDAAYNFAQQAYEMIPNDPIILDTIGWITVLRGQYTQGLSLLRQAFSMNAQDADLRYHLAFALHKLGRTQESKRELNVLLSDFASFNKRAEAEALMDEINKNAT